MFVQGLPKVYPKASECDGGCIARTALPESPRLSTIVYVLSLMEDSKIN